jgi:single-strand DNA-binding protein
MNFNNCFLIGHVTRDPEVKDISANSKVAVFRLAVNRSYKKGDEWVDKPTFVDCEAWTQKADYVASRIQTGTEVFVRGRLESDEWTAKDSGERRSKLKIYVLELQVGKKARSEDDAVGASSSNESIDDLPF